jgi:hypothetical protein
MKNYRLLAVAAIFTLLLSSCANVGRKARPAYRFQGMADPGSIVVTVDAGKEPDIVASAFAQMDEFASRTERISVSVKPGTDGYPLEGEDLSFYGILEGDFSRFLVNTALIYSSEVTREENSEEVYWFRQDSGPLSFAAIRNGEVLFTDGSYASAYAEVHDPVVRIDDATAAMMADASIALYAEDPETFFDLGLGLPASAVKQIRRIVLLVNESEEGHVLDAYITMDTSKLAGTLSQLVRTGYLARLKKEKIPFSIPELMKMFSIEDDLLTIEGMAVTDEQLGLLKQNLNGFV